jgi:hypothetical protein
VYLHIPRFRPRAPSAHDRADGCIGCLRGLVDDERELIEHLFPAQPALGDEADTFRDELL